MPPLSEAAVEAQRKGEIPRFKETQLRRQIFMSYGKKATTDIVFFSADSWLAHRNKE